MTISFPSVTAAVMSIVRVFSQEKSIPPEAALKRVLTQTSSFSVIIALVPAIAFSWSYITTSQSEEKHIINWESAAFSAS